MDKAGLRKELKDRIRNYPYKTEESAYIVHEILTAEEYREASVILAFCPLKSEPDISPLLEDPRVALPYIEDGRMKFAKAGRLEKSPLGFLEPKEKKEISFSEALVLVPMLGFDSRNYRLGRGGGFYDRFLAENEGKTKTLGVAFSISEVEAVPVEWNDRKLDRIIKGKSPNRSGDRCES